MFCDGMTDEGALIQANKNKGRSASVCFPSRNERVIECAVDVLLPRTPPPSAAAATENATKYFRRPASRSQSARITGTRVHRKRATPSATINSDGHDNFHPVKAGISDTKLHDTTTSTSGSGTCSPVSFRRKSSSRRVNSEHHSYGHRKSAAFLDIPKNDRLSCSNQEEEFEENSYRLRSFSFTTKGLINRGDSFRKRHGRSNSIFPITGNDATAKDNQSNDSASTTICMAGTFACTAITTALTTTTTTTTPTPTPTTTTTISDSSVTAVFPTNMSNSNVITYNVSVVGATGVGKTSLISQFMTSECINPYDRDRDEPSQQTVSIMLNGEESELCFHEMRHSKALPRKCVTDAFLVIYSVVDKSTFQYAETELSKLQDSNVLLNRPAILVGNKIDLARSRAVSSQDGKCLACTFRVKYIEISVGINHNVDELLVGILNQIRLKRQHCEQENFTRHWYKSRGMIRATMKARQMFTWIFGREDSKFKNCENLHSL